VTDSGKREGVPESSSSEVLEYLPEAQRTNSSAVAFQIFTAPLAVGMGVAALGFRPFVIPAIVATAAGMYLYQRHERRTPYIIFQVSDGVLYMGGRRRPGRTEISLQDLCDVSLDTKTIERVQENPTGFPELRFINSTIGPKIDTARIELETRDGSIFLTEHRVSYLDSSEWANKLRRFLRRQGWVPEDERE
jgi:hypothetical protein